MQWESVYAYLSRHLQYFIYRYLFHRLTGTDYLYSGCLPWYNVLRSINLTGPIKREIQSTVTAAVSCDGRISVLNHCLSWSKFVNTHLSHSSQWFNIHLTRVTSMKLYWLYRNHVCLFLFVFCMLLYCSFYCIISCISFLILYSLLLCCICLLWRINLFIYRYILGLYYECYLMQILIIPIILGLRITLVYARVSSWSGRFCNAQLQRCNEYLLYANRLDSLFN